MNRIHRTKLDDHSVEALILDLEDLGMDIAAKLVEGLRLHLQIVLDCYAAQIPTAGHRIEHAKELINWTKEAAKLRDQAHTVLGGRK